MATAFYFIGLLLRLGHGADGTNLPGSVIFAALEIHQDDGYSGSSGLIPPLSPLAGRAFSEPATPQGSGVITKFNSLTRHGHDLYTTSGAVPCASISARQESRKIQG
jgi:hypothetical protein